MFYLIYNPTTDTYRNEAGGWGSLAEAERFAHPDSCVILDGDERFVGPCIEGETL